mmetsp:Transcript_137279/g.238745  ORF Transcript_137279/g.238745 Transcript_137279/m.238745 type:complete len:278 (+) Transcript_137279:2-835(+)
MMLMMMMMRMMRMRMRMMMHRCLLARPLTKPHLELSPQLIHSMVAAFGTIEIASVGRKRKTLRQQKSASWLSVSGKHTQSQTESMQCPPLRPWLHLRRTNRLCGSTLSPPSSSRGLTSSVRLSILRLRAPSKYPCVQSGTQPRGWSSCGSLSHIRTGKWRCLHPRNLRRTPRRWMCQRCFLRHVRSRYWTGGSFSVGASRRRSCGLTSTLFRMQGMTTCLQGSKIRASTRRSCVSCLGRCYRVLPPQAFRPPPETFRPTLGSGGTQTIGTRMKGLIG